MSEKTTLKLAIQKSGRLSEESIKLIRDCGIILNRNDNRLKNEAINFPIDVISLRDDDIPRYISDGVVDAGIVGENLLFEYEKENIAVEKLGFSKCRLCIAVPNGFNYEGPQSLEGKYIATSYPTSLKRYLKKNNVNASIREITGSTEIAPGIGLADAICDIVSSGSTLVGNGLKEVDTVLSSQAVLACNTNLSNEKSDIFEDFLFRVQAVQKARRSKYIMLNAQKDNLNEILSILPGLHSPTVMPLSDENWVSIHTVIQEDEFWSKIEKLKDAGAEGILVLPIEKIIL